MTLLQKTVSRDGWCRHRTPFTSEHKTCKVGVDFHQFKGVKGSMIDMMPCLGESAEAIARCPQFSAYTPEENAAREKAFTERFTRIGIIRAAIIEDIAAKGRSSGDMACPCCKVGTVTYSQASNGHVHAKCRTKDCASWME